MTCMAEFTPHAGELLICFEPGDVVLDSFFPRFSLRQVILLLLVVFFGVFLVKRGRAK